MADRWKWVKDEIHKGNIRIGYSETTCPGTYAVEATIGGLPMPIATVWIRHSGNKTIETLQSYVMAPLRRCGLRTLMHRRMIRDYPSTSKVTTGAGSKEGGKAWLQSTGFKQNAEGDWVYRVKKRDR